MKIAGRAECESYKKFHKELLLNIFFSVLPPMASGRPMSGLDFSGIQVPGSSGGVPRNARDETAMIRDMLLANPDQLAMLQQNNPALAEGN